MTLPNADLPGIILVADDDEDVRHYAKEILERHGYSCDCAAHAEEALGLLSSRAYDLLVSDIRMPGNQNLDFIRRVAGLRAGLPVILMTAYPSLPTAMGAINLPVIAYLVKPIDFEELMRQIQRGVAFRRVSATLLGIKERLQGWVADTELIRKEFDASPGTTVKGVFFGAMTLTLGKLAGTLLDLQELFRLALELEGNQPDGDVLPNSPRIEALERALAEGVEVLSATKEAYRSKELGALRKRFEALVPPKL